MVILKGEEIILLHKLEEGDVVNVLDHGSAYAAVVEKKNGLRTLRPLDNCVFCGEPIHTNAECPRCGR